MANRLTVERISTTDNRVTVKFNCVGRIKKFFMTNKFFAEYSVPIETTPESLLVIPFLAAVMPITWASNAEVNVENIDQTFLESLETVKNSMQRFYPRLRLGGTITAKKVSKDSISPSQKRMVLFSGGSDSLATFIRHRNENLTLVHVYNADITQQKKANRNMDVAYIKNFCSRNKLPLITISSSFNAMLDYLMLSGFDKYIDEETDYSWWGRIMHGLALIGLCAPITYILKIEKLYIASSYTKDFSGGWGSHPDIDNNVKWTGMTVFHDGYELSRQDKMNIIADYAKNFDRDFTIQSCFELKNGENCNHCEKCARTIVGLELAGMDPNKYGFKVTNGTFQEIQNKLLKGAWYFGDDQRFMWGDIKSHAYQKDNVIHQEAEALIEWLLNTDVNSLPSAIGKPKFDLKTYMRPFLNRSPYLLYRILKKFYYFCRIVFPFMK